MNDHDFLKAIKIAGVSLASVFIILSAMVWPLGESWVARYPPLLDVFFMVLSFELLIWIFLGRLLAVNLLPQKEAVSDGDVDTDEMFG